jgi:hypothetical protein
MGFMEYDKIPTSRFRKYQKLTSMLRIETREDCIMFLCECGECDLPVATLRRDRNAGLRIESNHHGKKHTNVLNADDLAWIKAYISGPKESIIRKGLHSVTAACNIETLKL